MVKRSSPTLPHQECTHTQALSIHRNTTGKIKPGVTTTNRMESIQILPLSNSLDDDCWNVHKFKIQKSRR